MVKLAVTTQQRAAADRCTCAIICSYVRRRDAFMDIHAVETGASLKVRGRVSVLKYQLLSSQMLDKKITNPNTFQLVISC